MARSSAHGSARRLLRWLIHIRDDDSPIHSQRLGKSRPPNPNGKTSYRSLDLLFGSNPSANSECGKYAMMYWCQHLEIAARLDEAIDFNSAIGWAYQRPVDQDPTDSSFKSRWMKNRPLRFVITESDWAIMSRNVRKANAAIHGQTPDDGCRTLFHT